ncbi:hypothetical protein [Leisingera daeponensis]|uniref:hypothetical protein n=1 Tax=Leisingera daeponensis TaxID=405746 RepID=UPI001C986FA6|nr:hypothetical protein [Leisingera daeponensis]MBY6054956.1 hypothetical protein [Leisingera daeponensis]
MIDLDQIEAAVRAQRGSWQTLFRRQGAAGWQCILYPRRILTNDEYQALVARLSAPDGGAALSPAERQRNKLRAIADASDAGGRRYGR